MSVQAGIEVSLEMLVGEMSELACESEYHEDDKGLHDNGPATQYVQVFHECLGPIGQIQVRCSAAASSISAHAETRVSCEVCGVVGKLATFLIVLAPIKP